MEAHLKPDLDVQLQYLLSQGFNYTRWLRAQWTDNFLFAIFLCYQFLALITFHLYFSDGNTDDGRWTGKCCSGCYFRGKIEEKFSETCAQPLAQQIRISFALLLLFFLAIFVLPELWSFPVLLAFSWGFFENSAISLILFLLAAPQLSAPACPSACHLNQRFASADASASGNLALRA